ncbi:hypothetical protein AY606_00220 [Acinetobacter sp. SFB]|uniref:hypothetical protein n=1 Tax=Acinetobacter sp. SFB TaxID=1805634 RepID=UPI0007D86A26|nr:hypothetical protein [Acinetobacter sp. SFB]OAL81223.1 hypothetical protein AY606_00220 [Acinetobacter sp. SFB]
MNYSEIILSNFPSKLGVLTPVGDSTQDISSFKYLGYVNRQDYKILMENTLQKLFLSLILYEKIYISDKDFIKLVEIIGWLDGLELLEQGIVKIFYDKYEPSVTAHRSKKHLLLMPWYEIESTCYIRKLDWLDINYKDSGLKSVFKGKVVNTFQDAYINLEDVDEKFYNSTIKIINELEQKNIKNLDYQDTLRILRVYEIFNSFQQKKRFDLSTHLVDGFAREYLQGNAITSLFTDERASKLEKFESLTEEKGIPDIYELYRLGLLNIKQVLEIRDDLNTRKFREWFLEPLRSDNEIFYDVINKQNIFDKVNWDAIKFATATLVGVADPLSGLLTSIIFEREIFKKTTESWHPTLFLDDVLNKKLNKLIK